MENKTTLLVRYIPVDIKNSIHNVIWLRRFLLSILLIAFLVQVVIAKQVGDVALAAMAYIASVIITGYVFNKKIIDEHLVSRLILIGGAYSLLGSAIIAKSFTIDSLSSGLQHPFETITFATMIVFVFLLAHVTYRNLSRNFFSGTGLVKKLYMKTGLFREVSSVEVLLLSLMGLASILITWIFFLKDFEGSSFGRLLSLFSVLYFAPIVYIFYEKKYKRTAAIMLVVMIPVCLAVSALTGRRGFFADYALAVLGAFLLMSLIGAYRLRGRNIRQFIFVIFLAFPVLSIFQTISDAILSIRNDFHETLEYSDNINAVIAAFSTEKIDEPDVIKNDLYANEFSEVYTGNFVFDRFVLIKYMDNLVDFHVRAPDIKERLWAASVGMLNNLLPRYIKSIIPLSSAEPGTFAVMDEARCKALGECGDAYIFGSWVYMVTIFFGYVGGILVVFFGTMLIFSIADFVFIAYDSMRGVAFSVPLMLTSANVFWFSLYSSSPAELLINYLRFFPRGIVIICFSLFFVGLVKRTLSKK